MTFIGYSAYAGTKYALRALAETLQSELVGFNIKVYLACPVDTETPGFHKENETKPKETSIISGAASCDKPEDVAKFFVKELKRGYFYLNPSTISSIVINSTRGLYGGACPIMDIVRSFISSLVIPIVAMDFTGTSKKYAEERRARWLKFLSAAK